MVRTNLSEQSSRVKQPSGTLPVFQRDGSSDVNLGVGEPQGQHLTLLGLDDPNRVVVHLEILPGPWVMDGPAPRLTRTEVRSRGSGELAAKRPHNSPP